MPYITYVTPPCMVCGVETEMQLLAHSYAKWAAGVFVQDAFPSMSADEREMIITGTHPNCWDMIIPSD